MLELQKRLPLQRPLSIYSLFSLSQAGARESKLLYVSNPKITQGVGEARKKETEKKKSKSTKTKRKRRGNRNHHEKSKAIRVYKRTGEVETKMARNANRHLYRTRDAYTNGRSAEKDL